MARCPSEVGGSRHGGKAGAGWTARPRPKLPIPPSLWSEPGRQGQGTACRSSRGSGSALWQKTFSQGAKQQKHHACFPKPHRGGSRSQRLGLPLLPLPYPGMFLWNPYPALKLSTAVQEVQLGHSRLSSPHLRHDADAMRRNEGQDQGPHTRTLPGISS